MISFILPLLTKVILSLKRLPASEPGVKTGADLRRKISEIQNRIEKMRRNFGSRVLRTKAEMSGKAKSLRRAQGDRRHEVSGIEMVLSLDRERAPLRKEIQGAKHSRETGVFLAFSLRRNFIVHAPRHWTGAHPCRHRRGIAGQAPTPNDKGKQKGKTQSCEPAHKPKH